MDVRAQLRERGIATQVTSYVNSSGDEVHETTIDSQSSPEFEIGDEVVTVKGAAIQLVTRKRHRTSGGFSFTRILCIFLTTCLLLAVLERLHSKHGVF